MVDTRQIIVAAGSPSATDPQVVLSHRLWFTDSHLATLNLVQAGLGWAYLPAPLVATLIASGSLQEVKFDNMASQLRLWVDIVWSSGRPLGLGARRYLELIGERIQAQPPRG